MARNIRTDDLEVFLPFPKERDEIAPATHWRTTWVISSVQTLRARGHFERYQALLPREHAPAILMAVAGVWMPNAVARVHYETCGSLHLPLQEQTEMGLAVGARAQGSLLGTVIRMAKQSGVDPWTVFAKMQRLWDRGADGGGVAVYKLGPKEALLEVVGEDLFDVPYFRYAFSGVVQGLLQLFAKHVYAHDVSAHRAACMVRFQWA